MGVTAYESLDATAGVEILSLRVLVVADVSAEHVHGGAERMLFHHLRALKEAGMKVTVLTRQPTPDAASTITLNSGFTEHRLTFSGDKGYQGLKQLKIEAKRWWTAHAHAFDVVVAEQPFVMWALLKAGCTLPRLQICHSFAFEEYATRHGLQQTWKNRVITWFMRRLEQKVYRSAQKHLILSQFMQQRLLNFFAIDSSSTMVVPGAADAPIKRSAAMRSSLRQQLGWQAPTIITLRNLVPRTGVDLMIQAAAIVQHTRDDVRWVIMGDGLLRQSLQHMATSLNVGDKIEFTGFLSEKEVHHRLLAADVFMVPTRALEGFGLVTLEANACGLPVLATPIAANQELVPTIIHNALASSASPAALAKQLLFMLDENINEQQRQNIQKEAQNAYHWQHHDNNFITLLNTTMIRS